MYISYYGGGAVFDAAETRIGLSERDPETGEDLCVYLVDVGNPECAARLLNYCREGNTRGFDDAYQAAGALAAFEGALIYCASETPPCMACGHTGETA